MRMFECMCMSDVVLIRCYVFLYNQERRGGVIGGERGEGRGERREGREGRREGGRGEGEGDDTFFATRCVCVLAQITLFDRRIRFIALYHKKSLGKFPNTTLIIQV
jgi:hypothetical protein